MATAFPLMNVKASTKQAKQIAFMTLLHHNILYMILYRMVTIHGSLITKEFAQKLAAAKTDDQLDALVNEIITRQLPNPIQAGWKIPTLEELEPEVIHMTTDWKDRRVSTI